MCVLADDAKRLLGDTASWRENFVLGGAHFFDDVTVTHSDAEYFAEMYETKFDPDLAAEPASKEQEEMLAFAKGEKAPGGELSGEKPGFRPMYYTKTYQERPECIEMSFDCSHYQHQFREGEDSKDDKPHVYQTIFLDKGNEDMWTKKQIREDKVIKVKWWHQLGHRWQHYVRVVPGMRFLNGRRSTYFAGSWTLVNMHELACVSGIAAAYRLGAEYRQFDDFAESFFGKYLWLSHGVRYKRKKNGHSETKA
ncbi:hypothetical protein R3P38DRAFT_2926882 [Favolaschia claudopus]|uniref:Uncharacterized protein n=1 Tax=Favolaschia claudopus TaxID=2862362 RepID=A0AAW0BUN7_9AGAR